MPFYVVQSNADKAIRVTGFCVPCMYVRECTFQDGDNLEWMMAGQLCECPGDDQPETCLEPNQTCPGRPENVCPHPTGQLRRSLREDGRLSSSPGSIFTKVLREPSTLPQPSMRNLSLRVIQEVSDSHSE